ncbi:hypothetical protein V6N13_086692 [Hibiscus sabdariffa]
MEDYSKGRAEDTGEAEAEAPETPGNEDSSSSNGICDKEEKVVSESAGLFSPTADTKPGDSDAAELDAKETEQPFSAETTRDYEELVLIDVGVGPKETTLPPALDETNGSTVDGAVVASDNAGNSASKQNVEDSLQAPVVEAETRDAGGGEVVDKPDIDETMETQPIVFKRHHELKSRRIVEAESQVHGWS